MSSIQQRALQFFRDQSLASNWLDTPFRSLQGKTPRESAKTPEGEQKAIALLETVLIEEKRKVKTPTA